MINNWLSQSLEDLNTAKNAYKTQYPKPLHTICYLSQQAAEKAVKATIIYVGFGDTLPKTHDISFLLNQIVNKVDYLHNMFEHAKFLTDYGSFYRYPSEIPIDESISLNSIRYADEIYNWSISIVESNMYLK